MQEQYLTTQIGILSEALKNLQSSVNGLSVELATLQGDVALEKLCVRLYMPGYQIIYNNTWMAIPMVPDTTVNLGGYSNVLVSQQVSGSGAWLNGPNGAAVYRFIAPKNGVYSIAGNTQVDTPYETGHTLESVIYKCDSDDSNDVWIKRKIDEDRLHFGNSSTDATNTGNYSSSYNNSAFNKRTHELQDTVYLTRGQKVWMAVNVKWYATNNPTLVLGGNTGFGTSMTVTEI